MVCADDAALSAMPALLAGDFEVPMLQPVKAKAPATESTRSLCSTFRKFIGVSLMSCRLDEVVACHP
jgi:hypothetical protein